MRGFRADAGQLTPIQFNERGIKEDQVAPAVSAVLPICRFPQCDTVLVAAALLRLVQVNPPRILRKDRGFAVRKSVIPGKVCRQNAILAEMPLTETAHPSIYPLPSTEFSRDKSRRPSFRVFRVRPVCRRSAT